MRADLASGIRVPGNVINLALAGAANALPIFQQSNWANQVGTKTFKLKKLMVRNLNAGNNFLQVGTGVAGAFVNRIPPIMTVNNMDQEFTEFDLPDYVFAQDCTAFPVALVAGGSMDVQVEVEEIG